MKHADKHKWIRLADEDYYKRWRCADCGCIKTLVNFKFATATYTF